MNEDDLFRQMMGDKVQPIQKESRVQPQRVNKKHAILNRLENKAFHTTASQHHARLSVQRIGDDELKADGVSTKDVKKLAQMNIKLALDLHGLTQAEAEQAMQQFISQAIYESERYLCIIHGQGRHSKEGKSVLKHFTYQWLKHGTFSSYILIATTSKQSGGGACNILLRK
ncbi:MAG: Smr/MutS family protein [Ghiorsea sp.]|nr:Smr/MutS family protein [Ghiorsea sp.]